MKKNQVPQDDENLTEGTRELQYAIDENGNYIAVKSSGWETKNTVIKHNWEFINEEIEEARLEVKEGKYSPIYFFMKKNLMDTKLLSEYTGIPKRKVKKHLKPNFFDSIAEMDLKKYLSVFKLANLEELKNM